MMNVSILLRHLRVWKSDLSYQNYKSDGIVVGPTISCVNLKAAIVVELDIDESEKKIRDPIHN